MSEFFENCFNIKKMMESKREYQKQMARVKVLPEDYQYVFQKIQAHMGNCIASIHFIAALNGVELFDSISHIEQILAQDPDGTYPLMDMATRSQYRNRIEELALTLGVSELHIAKDAVDMAQNAGNYCVAGDSLNDQRCIRHVGFYLFGKGLPYLIKKQRGRKRKMTPLMNLPKRRLGLLYFGSIGLVTLMLTSIAILYTVMVAQTFVVLLSILAGIIVLAPAMEIGVQLVNWVVCKALRPMVFPRLALKEGIPETMGTIVAVPTLLPDLKRTLEIIANLEGQYLRNREKNLYFALIGAFKDSDNRVNHDQHCHYEHSFHAAIRDYL